MCYSNVTTIIFLGFQWSRNFTVPFFIMFLVIFCGTLCGNLLIVMLVSYNKSLHSPMYFFLTQLSISDILVSSDVVPNLLQVNTMPFRGCMVQFYLFGLLEISESLLLTVMSYDRYVAICSPLHYNAIMNFGFCVKLTIMSWLISFVVVVLQFSQVCQLHFCGPNIIDHFFCDYDPVLKLSCSSVFTARLIASFTGIPLFFCTFLVIAISYFYIIYTIVRMDSITGRQKAFSTCGSHFAVVSLYFVGLNAMYFVPIKGKSQMMGKAVSLLYTVVTPFFNPIIYCLRNKDITNTFKKVIVVITKNIKNH